MHDADRATRALAADTAGVIGRARARELGLGGRLLARRIRDGTWLAPTPRVLVLAGTPATFERDAWIALWDAGFVAALSHDTALAWWSVPGFARYPVHVSRDRSRSAPARKGVLLHRSHLWPSHHRLEVNGIPTVTPTRALFDVINEAETHPVKLERAVNNAWARGLTSGELLAAMAAEWCERGRRGSVWVREYLATRPVGWEPPASNLEARFSRLVVAAGMPEPKRQRNLGDDHSWIGRVDMLDPEVPLVAEIDSDLFHTAPLDVAADAVRDERLRSGGFDVVRFTEFEVWHRGDSVVDRWREARRAARSKH